MKRLMNFQSTLHTTHAHVPFTNRYTHEMCLMPPHVVDESTPPYLPGVMSHLLLVEGEASGSSQLVLDGVRKPNKGAAHTLTW